VTEAAKLYIKSHDGIVATVRASSEFLPCVGMPGDNAWSESFFATMKKELIHWTHYGTKESVRAAVFEYIYCFYNVKRIQKRLGYMSPREYLRSLRTERSADAT